MNNDLFTDYILKKFIPELEKDLRFSTGAARSIMGTAKIAR